MGSLLLGSNFSLEAGCAAVCDQVIITEIMPCINLEYNMEGFVQEYFGFLSNIERKCHSTFPFLYH